MLLLQNPQISRTDLNLIQLIKAGREGAFYKARMLRGTCKGHSFVTCKIAKEGSTSRNSEFINPTIVKHELTLQVCNIITV